MTTAARDTTSWDEAYRGTPPWDIGRPQPVFARLAEEGAFAGRLIDVGCGSGEHTLLAAAHGGDALGIDVSAVAVEHARRKAAERGSSARFEVRDGLKLGELDERFEVALDSGVYHVFDTEAMRSRYAAAIGAVLEPGGVLFLLCFSLRTPGDWGPKRIREDELRRSFADGWEIVSIEPAHFELNPGNPVARADVWSGAFRRR